MIGAGRKLQMEMASAPNDLVKIPAPVYSNHGDLLPPPPPTRADPVVPRGTCRDPAVTPPPERGSLG